VLTFGFDRLLRNRRGNVAMMYALVAPILVFAAAEPRSTTAGGANSYKPTLRPTPPRSPR
jgi:hypothetical protein